VADTGSGIAPETITKILDYTVRASDKEAYVSPTRGAQGKGGPGSHRHLAHVVGRFLCQRR
jgi:hypothetical protein